MGKIISLVQRSANRFNVENRAHKIISKEKPTPAPMHPYAKEQLEKLIKEHPEIIEQHHQKDPHLHKHLEQIYVTSQDPDVNPDTVQKGGQEEATLPHNRQTYDDPEFGFHEPTMIPYGRVTLRQAIKLIMDHQSDSEKWTVESVANTYKLSPEVAGDILKYFRTFEVYIPSVQDNRTKISGPENSGFSLGSGKSP